MNNPNPFVPQGSLLEQQSLRRSRLKLAVFCGLTVSVAGLVVMLIQGCKREQPAADAGTPPPDLNSNVLPAANLAPTPPDTNVALAPSNAAPITPPIPTPAPAPSSTLPPIAAAPAAGTDYLVQPGDTLAKIAKNQGVSLKALEAANPGVDSRKLKVKQKLTIPAKAADATGAATTPAAAPAAGATDAGGESYAVKSGDTLSKIAKHHGVSLKALRAANPKIASTDHIHVGDKLVIPAKTEAATPTPTDTAAAAPATAPATTPAPVAPATTPAPTPATSH